MATTGNQVKTANGTATPISTEADRKEPAKSEGSTNEAKREEENEGQKADRAKGYLIALIQRGDSIKLYGCPSDRGDCDEILQINGKSFSDKSQHSEMVEHIYECIKLRNICLRVKRTPIALTSDKESILLDVFVIGSDARKQLERFFTITKILANQPDYLKLTDKMEGVVELVELNNQSAIIGGPTTFQINQQINSQQLSQAQQQQINMDQMYLERQQQQHHHQQQQRFGNTPKIPKHRELPVDVPDSFVGIAKQSPRYPPPKQHRQVSPSVPVNNMGMFDHQTHSRAFSPNNIATTNTNSNGQNIYIDANISSVPIGVSSNNSVNASVNTIAQQSFPMSPLSQNTTADNLLQHNSSLRNSIKLKQLEKSRADYQPKSAVNQAFEMDEDDSENPPSSRMVTTTSLQQHSSNKADLAPTYKQLQQVPLIDPDVCAVYDRLQRNMDGDFADVSSDAKLSKLLSIYKTILKTHGQEFRIPPLMSRLNTILNTQGEQEPMRYSLTDLLQSVMALIHGEEMTSDSAELFKILRRHDMEGVCSAFDRIAQSFAFAKSDSTSTPSPINHRDRLMARSQQNQNYQSEQLPLHHSQNMEIPIPDNEMSLHQTNQQILPNTGHLGSPIHNDRYYQQHHLVSQHQYASGGQVQMDLENNLYQGNMHQMTDIDLSDGGLCTRTVRVEKTSDQALGATIKNEKDGSVIIGRIVCGGAAYRSGLLHEGDEILEVNGVGMRGRNINEVVDILENMLGTLTFVVISRGFNKPATMGGQQEKIMVRAFFDYDGENDKYNPCKELGLTFKKGEVLAIIDRSDIEWWQAHREKDSEWHLAGLIPSINYLKQREKEREKEECSIEVPSKGHQKSTTGVSDVGSGGIGGGPNWRNSLVTKLCPRGTSPRRKKRGHHHFAPEDIPYYEEVCLYYPIKYRKRPIILVGPKMIGQREIVAKLLQDSSRFASAVSHTSKPQQDHERNGLDFHFVSRAQFEADIKAGKFIECGQYQNQYYGTSLDAMKEVVKSKKTCIHLVNTPSIFNFRNGRAGSELKPFFVFVKPDMSHPEKLRNIVSSFSQPKSNIEDNINAIVDEVELIEMHYLPYFDKVLTVSNVESAYHDLLHEIEKIEHEPQWIPMFWQDSPTS